MTSFVQRAIERLITNHRYEFDELIREEASADGALAETPYTLSIMDTVTQADKEKREWSDDL